MTLVTAALLGLAQIPQRAAVVLVEPGKLSPAETAQALTVRQGMGAADIKGFVARTFLQPVHAVIVDVRKVAEHAQGNAEQRVALAPVAVVVVPVALAHHRIVAAFQKVLSHREPHVDHVLLEQFDVFGRPFRVVAHDLRRVQKLVADKAGDEGDVGVAAEGLVVHAVGVEHVDRHVAVAFLASKLPQKGALVGARRIAVGVHVVVT